MLRNTKTTIKVRVWGVDAQRREVALIPKWESAKGINSVNWKTFREGKEKGLLRKSKGLWLHGIEASAPL